MDYTNVIYEVDGQIASITLNRPEKRNALSWALFADLSAALKEAEAERDVKVIILKGAGKCFSSGHDMSDTKGNSPKDRDRSFFTPAKTVWDSRAHVQGHIDYCLEIWNNWKPVIAQIHGYCLGGGSALALACDMLIASDDARLGYPPVRGMATGDEIAIYAWHMGLKKAKELSLTGDSLTAHEMLHYGVANYVFPKDKLGEETIKIAKRIAHIDIGLLALSKRVVNRTFDQMGFSASLQYGGEFDSLGHFSRTEWRNIVQTKGLKAALEWRDGPFGGIVGRYPPVESDQK